MADRRPGLSIAGVTHRFDVLTVVEDVTLSIAPGELVCLVGPSGCGKTTLLRLVAGLEEVQQGAIAIDGTTVGAPGRHVPPEARGIGMMFQDYALFPHLTIADNVGFGLVKSDGKARLERVRATLHQVGMEAYTDVYPHQLSGGQQQRVALARALAPQPRVMLLDEPFSGLDARLREQVRDDTLHVLKHSDAATLMVTHDPEEAMFMADRLAIMRAGQIVQAGRPVEVYGRPASAFVAQFFGQVNQVRGYVSGGAVRTPFGPVTANGLVEGAAADVLIRPEALRLSPIADGGEAECAGKVLASRLLGRSSWIHLCLGGQGGHGEENEPAEGEVGHLHFHARVHGRFLPAEGEVLAIQLDSAQVFVFPAAAPKS
ncbi:MAG TPA: ABC transporter ATP-binding protein [Alphaproteobacteria bacterium]|nr:ABC transporter ATP-binding protein [Alphaproteobacteria bacterium]